MKGHFKHPKKLSKYFLTGSDFKSTNNSFSPKWHLSTFSTTVFNLQSKATYNLLPYH